jgi:8-oxo-dGTP pyrophosphatase MutT (NUDIX family)
MNFKENLKYLLTKPLPGEDAQWRMAHIARERLGKEELDARNAKQSAVMVLFCLNENEEHFIPLTLRLDYKGIHANQVSFPGGKKEENDTSLEETALRECEEEIGILKKDIEILGRLTPLYIPVSNFMVYPFVGYCKTTHPAFMAQETEVKQILKLYSHDLKNETIVKKGIVNPMPKVQFETPYFEVEEHMVWGATAMILNEMKVMLEGD